MLPVMLCIQSPPSTPAEHPQELSHGFQSELLLLSELLSTYQCLEINLINTAFHCIIIYLFDQNIVILTFYVQHDLASFVICL